MNYYELSFCTFIHTISSITMHQPFSTIPFLYQSLIPKRNITHPDFLHSNFVQRTIHIRTEKISGLKSSKYPYYPSLHSSA